MTTIIDINETLDASGGANDSYAETYGVNTDAAAFQTTVGGATTDVDIHFEARLDSSLPWDDWLSVQATVSNGYSDIRGVDLEDVPEIRVRFVNNDGTNTGDVRGVVATY